MQTSHWLLFLNVMGMIAGPFAFGQGSGMLDELTDTQAQWQMALGFNRDLSPFYNERCGLFYEGKLHVGSEEIVACLRGLQKESGVIDGQTLATMSLNENYASQLLKYTAKSGEVYYSVTGFTLIEGKWLREFEAICPADAQFEDRFVGLDSQRRAWVMHSNNHQPEKIATEICWPEACYFNQGMVYEGLAIAERYSYMKNDTWQIELQAERVIRVNDTIAFEIGTYMSGGKGLYVLVWKRSGSLWRILTDFNF